MSAKNLIYFSVLHNSTKNKLNNNMSENSSSSSSSSSNSSISSSPPSKPEQDDDNPLIKVNPWVDNILGVLFLILCGVIAKQCLEHHYTGQIFLVSLVFVIIAVKTCRAVAYTIGRMLSSRRTGV